MVHQKLSLAYKFGLLQLRTSSCSKTKLIGRQLSCLSSLPPPCKFLHNNVQKTMCNDSANVNSGFRLYSQTKHSYKLVEVNEHDGVRKILMNDKKTRNALSLEMMTELISAIDLNKSDVNLRCIVITTPKDFPVFSSGHNLKQLTTENGVQAQKEIFARCSELMLSIRNSEVPVIAVVHGLAAAAGCQLVAACDFSVVSEKSSFSTPGASFGLFCSTPGIAVSRAANRSTAAFMVLTGQSITAKEAQTAGLVTKVVSDENLDNFMQDICKSIKSKSRAVIQLGKQFFYQQLEMPYRNALREGEAVMVKNLQFEDCQEGLNSFKEKRHPVWTHSDKTVQET